jgi:hypothetical protein
MSLRMSEKDSKSSENQSPGFIVEENKKYALT